MADRTGYTSPLSTRYSSNEMQYVFSEEFKFRTWRRLWISLAKAEKQLGLDITDEQIAELEAHADDINFEVAEARERIVRHDVMSHVYAYGVQCPKAEPIIHLGATSCYVGDNTDVIILREASRLVLKKAARVIKNLAVFADKYKALPCLAYTHLQPAQLTTVGKRATLWMNELAMDIENLEWQLANLKLLGSKGTTGTQASFMELFSGDEIKVKKLEQLIAARLFPVWRRVRTNSQTICVFCSRLRKWRSRLKRIRSARPQCRTNAIRCAANVYAHSRDMSLSTASILLSPPEHSGSSARLTTAQTSAYRLPKRSSQLMRYSIYI